MQISESEVKKQAHPIKSIIKFDKCFHIYMHRSRELIKRGMDEFDRNFYKMNSIEES